MRSFAFSDWLSTSTLFVFLVGIAFLVGCDSGGPDMPNQGLTLEKLSGNWELTAEYRSSDAYDASQDPMWYRVIPKDEITDKFPGADSLENVPGVALLHVIQGDCTLEAPGVFITEIQEDAFMLGPDVKVDASVEDSTLTLPQSNGVPFKLRPVEEDIFQLANNDHPAEGFSCDFKDIDTPFPTRR